MNNMHPKYPCKAKDPSVCPYHGAFLRLELAEKTQDYAGYAKARTEVEKLQANKSLQEAEKQGLSTQKVVINFSEDEQKIYNNYRLALKVVNKTYRHGNGKSTVAERKQKARKVTVDRYNIPYTDLKDIISKGDAVKGIEHARPTNDQNALDLENANRMFEKNPEPCSKCGTTENVSVSYNPFDVEVSGIYKMMVSCRDCYNLEAEELVC